MRNSCWNSQKWDSFWIYATATNDFLGGACKFFVQSNTITSSLTAPFISLEPLPFVGWSIPSVAFGSVLAALVSAGTAVADAMGNEINLPQNRAELEDIRSRYLDAPGISDLEKATTTDDESYSFGSHIQIQNERTPLKSLKKTSRSCCCQGLSIFQAGAVSLDIFGHILEAGTWLFLITLVVKAAGMENVWVPLGITIAALVLGPIASQGKNKTHLTLVRDYSLWRQIQTIKAEHAEESERNPKYAKLFKIA